MLVRLFALHLDTKCSQYKRHIYWIENKVSFVAIVSSSFPATIANYIEFAIALAAAAAERERKRKSPS